ncbi:protoporphyrinogen oxidase [Dietzia sp. UCD-THP]|uniref:FAD-dependent oxidoreductase n=1 Tax=Dietzia sp. UCD-THP TaxID=1292020 RepID=UPI000378DF0C|nr:FAD-dependent oxidoreductase [Dietzia sp. UCD-THP]EYT63675.1 protoporphyrinogen oxidase [Dietzia sp. UCD-THP]
MAPRVAVIGAGLSGLTAAYQLALDLPDARITVLEASDIPGGALHTVDFPSGPMELGAEAFIGRRPEASELVAELGLTDALRHPGPLGPAILTGGRLVSMPVGTVMGLPSDVAALTGVLTPAETDVAARERDTPLEWEPGGDVSLGRLVAERFGDAVVSRLVDPMLGGVYAAPSSGLGLRQVVPGLAEVLDRGAPSLTEAVGQLVGDRVPGPVFAALDGGYRTLVASLIEASGARVRTQAACTAIHREPSGYALTVTGERGSWVEDADLVVVAVPVPHAAPLLAAAGGVDDAVTGLTGIRTASSAVVAMEVDRGLDLPGLSGVLVATDEPVPFKAMTFTSRKWPHLDTRPGHLVRVSFGRLDDDEVLLADDIALARMAESALAGVCGSAPRILHSRVRRWEDSLAEIGPAHADRIADVRAGLADRLPGVELVGGATEGVGVPACIGSARAAARRLAAGWQD